MHARSRNVWTTLVAGLAIGALFSSGCGPAGAPAIDTGFLGVTQGGVQDNATARSRIESGQLPDPATISVEGFFSEHDIPLTPPENAPEIYASVGYAWRRPFAEPFPIADIFVRMGTTIDINSYKRNAQHLAVVVDRSGSMDDPASATDGRSKLDAVKQALHSLLDKLNADDALALISFSDNVRVDVPLTAVDKTGTFAGKIDGLKALGSTNLYAALQRAFKTLADNADDQHDSRVILFSDGLPTNSDSADQIVALQREFAARGVYLTVMGVGDDFGVDLTTRMSHERGANTYFLDNSDRIAQIFNDEFDYLVTPVAFDLKFRIAIPDGIGIRDVYGVPDYVPGASGAEVTVPTLFFSRREGGGVIIIRLTFATTPTFDAPVPIADLGMSYTLRDGTVRQLGQSVTLPTGIAPNGDPAFYSDTAVHRAAVLLDTAKVLIDAATSGAAGNYAAGMDRLQQFLDGWDNGIRGLSDNTDSTSRSLGDERALLQKLYDALSAARRGAYYYWY